MNSRTLVEKTGLSLNDFVNEFVVLLVEFKDTDLVYMLQQIELEILERQDNGTFLEDTYDN